MIQPQTPNPALSGLPEYERRGDGNEREERDPNTGFFSHLTLINGVMALGLFVYLYFFVVDLERYWFHGGWTTDDALQQWFPLHEILMPGRFQGDLIYDVMKGYLAPLHYWVSALATYLTQDVILASHWVMILQLGISVTFLFLGVKAAAGVAPALFSVFWLFHTRQIIQRFTAGLPRGWSGVVIPAFFYFAIKRNHTGVLITLLLGCLSHPPTTLICGGAYGLWLVYEVLFGEREKFIKPLLILLLLSPAYAFLTYKVVERPDSVGQMVGFEEASAMPQFQVPTGRFPFLPHPKVSDEWRTFAFQPFTGRFYKPVKFLRRNIRWIVAALFLGLLSFALVRRRHPIPLIVIAFFISLTTVYFLSRPLAFKLYVPNRHLQFPMAFFWITAFPILLWNTFHKSQEVIGRASSRFREGWPPFVALLLLGGLIFAGSGSGLAGDANFNYSDTKKGKVFVWAKNRSPEDALFAGHPKLIDGMMLFGERRAFATNEVYHPFYRGYLEEIERRLEITFRAHYAKSLSELYEILHPEGIDYFVFDRRKFYPTALQEEKFYPPLADLVKELTSHPPESYAYKEIPREVDLEVTPYQVHRDEYSVVVDIKKLGEWLQ